MVSHLRKPDHITFLIGFILLAILLLAMVPFAAPAILSLIGFASFFCFTLSLAFDLAEEDWLKVAGLEPIRQGTLSSAELSIHIALDAGVCIIYSIHRKALFASTALSRIAEGLCVYDQQK